MAKGVYSFRFWMLRMHLVRQEGLCLNNSSNNIRKTPAMKKITLFSVLFLLSILVNGQVNKVSIGISGSPDFYNYQFKSIPGFEHEYKTKTNYSIGMSMNYNFAERLSVKTGLLFSTKGYVLDYSWLIAETNDPLLAQESNINISYLDIPVLISYDLLRLDKLSLFTSTGIVASFLIKENEISTMGDGTEKETEYSKTMFNQSFNKTLLAIDLEIGLKYNFNEKLFMSIAPYLRYGLNKISDEVLESNPLSYGASLGMHLNL